MDPAVIQAAALAAAAAAAAAAAVAAVAAAAAAAVAMVPVSQRPQTAWHAASNVAALAVASPHLLASRATPGA